MSKRLVVTGMGALTPIGADAPSYWDGLLRGACGIAPITRFDASGLPVRIAAEVRGFDAAAMLPRALARQAGRFVQFGYAAAAQALQASGLTPLSNPDRVGVAFGSAMGGIANIAHTQHAVSAEGARVGPRFITGALHNTAAAELATAHGIRGPSVTVSTACSSGGDAIAAAAWMLLSGEADAVLAVGADAAICPLTLSALAQCRALSRQNGNPLLACRPFDAARDGFVMGEGGGALVLETEAHALARGAPIHAVLAGWANTTDGYHATAPRPDGSGAADCIRRALCRAGLPPQAIGYINAHGTATPLGDRAETQAIKAVFGGREQAPPVSSTKGATGHLMGAGGITEVIACIFALQSGLLPPTRNFTSPDPDCDLNLIADEPRRAQIDAALSTSLGFGGQNAATIVTRYRK